MCVAKKVYQECIRTHPTMCMILLWNYRKGVLGVYVLYILNNSNNSIYIAYTGKTRKKF